MAIDKKLIDELLTNYKKPEDIIGENGLLKELTKAILERALAAEMTDHLGYEKHDPAGHHRGNTRNGKSQKTLRGDFGELELETPRDRQATFEPKIVAKGQTRWRGFDDKIISMYARGMTTREIQGHLEEIYGTVPILRHDVKPGTPPQGISQPLRSRLRREPDHTLLHMPRECASKLRRLGEAFLLALLAQ